MSQQPPFNGPEGPPARPWTNAPDQAWRNGSQQASGYPGDWGQSGSGYAAQPPTPKGPGPSMRLLVAIVAILAVVLLAAVTVFVRVVLPAAQHAQPSRSATPIPGERSASPSTTLTPVSPPTGAGAGSAGGGGAFALQPVSGEHTVREHTGTMMSNLTAMLPKMVAAASKANLPRGYRLFIQPTLGEAYFFFKDAANVPKAAVYTRSRGAWQINPDPSPTTVHRTFTLGEVSASYLMALVGKADVAVPQEYVLVDEVDLSTFRPAEMVTVTLRARASTPAQQQDGTCTFREAYLYARYSTYDLEVGPQTQSKPLDCTVGGRGD